MRSLSLIVCAVLGACSDIGLPDQSYTFPTAIFGVTSQSRVDSDGIKAVLESIAEKHHMTLDKTSIDSFGALSESIRTQIARTSHYSPPNPRMREGFSLNLELISSRCVLVSVAEYSGIWTRESLEVVKQLSSSLNELAGPRSSLLVRPKEGQNWPHQQTFVDPERPTFLEDLCVRMGAPDPRANAA